MLKSIVATVIVGAFGAVFLTGMADQPGEKGPKKDKKGGWEPGKIMPPHVRDALNLTEEQQKQIGELEKEVRTKLLNILTGEQKTRLKELNDKGPKGPPNYDGDGPPDKKGKGKKDKDKPRDDGEAKGCEPSAISSWQRGDACRVAAVG